MRFDEVLSTTLAELEALGRLRVPDDGAARAEVECAAAERGFSALDASSNDYLGLATSSAFVSRETPASAGAGASRLIHGTASEHRSLEASLAEWVGAESALLFSSTYAANVGLISAVGVAGAVIISDALNHASLIDGARLAKADVRVVPHLDIAAVEAALGASRGARAAFVITESYFSMDGDGPDLRALRLVCDKYDAALVVDEAHALGVFGPGGAGRCADAGMKAEVLIGALGKSVGTQGGFVAGSVKLRTMLWNRARSFVFSTAVSPSLSAVSDAHVKLARGADAQRNVLANNAAELRAQLTRAGLILAPGSFGPIISLVLGGNRRVLRAAARLRALGILAQAIRPPTVPDRAARLRLTVKATFTASDIARLANGVAEACRAS